MDDEARIARWMGWGYIDDGYTGSIKRWVHGDLNDEYESSPPYLTDWQLTGPLLERLMGGEHGEWNFDTLWTGDGYVGTSNGRKVKADTLQAAIVAAAIAQIDCEGE